MVLEQKKDELIIKLNKNKFNSKSLKNIIDYLEYVEATNDSKAKQDEIDELSREINKKWWKENRAKFIK